MAPQAVAEVFSGRYNKKYPPAARPDEGVTSRITGEIPVRRSSVPEEIALVEKAYSRYGGNVAAIERYLRGQGVDFSRKRISRILDKLSLPRIKRGKR